MVTADCRAVQPGTDTLLAKAGRAAATAAAALEAGAPEVAAGRAFYAMVYAAKALLNERGLRLHTHARIAAALARLGVGGEAPLQEWLADAMARRRSAESGELTYGETEALVDRARQFIAAARAQVQ